MKDYYTKSLSPYEQFQLERWGSYIPEGAVDETEYENEIKEPINETEINGDDDFNFHPDWYYESF